MDGVLITPKGYRASFRKTINFLTQRMGFGDLAPGEEYHLKCESLGITNEWDMVALCLATIFNAALDERSLVLPKVLLEACTEISLLHLQPPANIDFSPVISAVGAGLLVGISPAEVAFRIDRDGKQGTLFPNITNQPLLHSILCNTRDVANCLSTYLFQNFTLGSKGLWETYHLPELVNTPSMLQSEDERLISSSTRDLLIKFWDEGKLGMAVYTARPSLLPLGIQSTRFDYAPEAEYAVEIVGLNNLPLIAFGRMQYLSEMLNIQIDSLVKPSPVQALTAIIAGLGMPEVDALYASAAIARMAGLKQFENCTLQTTKMDFLFSRSPFQVHVFEDAPGGIRAAMQAVEILNQVGIPCSIYCWGVGQSHVKRDALIPLVCQVFWNIDDAIHFVISQI